MRTKGLLLLLICIAGSSIVFIAFSNQRPSIQTLVTETHKQLRSFQVSSILFIIILVSLRDVSLRKTKKIHIILSFLILQENLKDVEEKRLVTDSKYLALLGLDGQTSTTPQSLKPQNVTVVTLIRPGSEQHAYGFVRNVSHFLPNNSIVLYSVGLNEESFQIIKATCNSTRCNAIQFDLTPFPAHVEDDRLHVYRPLVIQVMDRLAHKILFHLS